LISKLKSSFPSQYVGRLTGIMWSVVGLTICLQYGLVKLTVIVPDSWKVRFSLELENFLCFSIGMVDYSCNGFSHVLPYNLSLEEIYSNKK